MGFPRYSSLYVLYITHRIYTNPTGAVAQGESRPRMPLPCAATVMLIRTQPQVQELG